MIRIDTLWTGAGAVGGGISQFFFSNDVAEAQACADAVQDFWDGLLTFINDSTSFEVGPAATELNQATGGLVSVTSLTTEGIKTGTASGDMMSPATQGLLRLQTGSVVNGRILRGRLFIPAVDEFHNSADGAPTSAYQAGLLAAGTQLMDDLTASWQVWHRPVAGSGGSMGIVESVSPSPKFAVLRSRRD